MWQPSFCIYSPYTPHNKAVHNSIYQLYSAVIDFLILYHLANHFHSTTKSVKVYTASRKNKSYKKEPKKIQHTAKLLKFQSAEFLQYITRGWLNFQALQTASNASMGRELLRYVSSKIVMATVSPFSYFLGFLIFSFSCTGKKCP